MTTPDQRPLLTTGILTAAAINGTTTTYLVLAEAVGTSRSEISRVLDRVRDLCWKFGLPPLHSLVVRKDTGEVGEGYRSFSVGNTPEQDRELCWEYFANFRALITQPH